MVLILFLNKSQTASFSSLARGHSPDLDLLTLQYTTLVVPYASRIFNPIQYFPIFLLCFNDFMNWVTRQLSFLFSHVQYPVSRVQYPVVSRVQYPVSVVYSTLFSPVQYPVQSCTVPCISRVQYPVQSYTVPCSVVYSTLFSRVQYPVGEGSRLIS